MDQSGQTAQSVEDASQKEEGIMENLDVQGDIENDDLLDKIEEVINDNNKSDNNVENSIETSEQDFLKQLDAVEDEIKDAKILQDDSVSSLKGENSENCEITLEKEEISKDNAEDITSHVSASNLAKLELTEEKIEVDKKSDQTNNIKSNNLNDEVNKIFNDIGKTIETDAIDAAIDKTSNIVLPSCLTESEKIDNATESANAVASISDVDEEKSMDEILENNEVPLEEEKDDFDIKSMENIENGTEKIRQTANEDDKLQSKVNLSENSEIDFIKPPEVLDGGGPSTCSSKPFGITTDELMIDNIQAEISESDASLLKIDNTPVKKKIENKKNDADLHVEIDKIEKGTEIPGLDIMVDREKVPVDESKEDIEISKANEMLSKENTDSINEIVKQSIPNAHKDEANNVEKMIVDEPIIINDDEPIIINDEPIVINDDEPMNVDSVENNANDKMDIDAENEMFENDEEMESIDLISDNEKYNDVIVNNEKYNVDKTNTNLIIESKEENKLKENITLNKKIDQIQEYSQLECQQEIEKGKIVSKPDNSNNAEWTDVNQENWKNSYGIKNLDEIEEPISETSKSLETSKVSDINKLEEVEEHISLKSHTDVKVAEKITSPKNMTVVSVCKNAIQNIGDSSNVVTSDIEIVDSDTKIMESEKPAGESGTNTTECEPKTIIPDTKIVEIEVEDEDHKTKIVETETKDEQHEKIVIEAAPTNIDCEPKVVDEEIAPPNMDCEPKVVDEETKSLEVEETAKQSIVISETLKTTPTTNVHISNEKTIENVSESSQKEIKTDIKSDDNKKNENYNTNKPDKPPDVSINQSEVVGSTMESATKGEISENISLSASKTPELVAAVSATSSETNQSNDMKVEKITDDNEETISSTQVESQSGVNEEGKSTTDKSIEDTHFNGIHLSSENCTYEVTIRSDKFGVKSLAIDRNDTNELPKETDNIDKIAKHSFSNLLALRKFIKDYFTSVDKSENIESTKSSAASRGGTKRKSTAETPKSSVNSKSRKRSLGVEEESEKRIKLSSPVQDMQIPTILARWVDKTFYPGKISETKPGNKYVVAFVDGQTKTVRKDSIIFGGEDGNLPLKDQVVHVMIDNNYEPGVVTSYDKNDNNVIMYTVITDSKTVKVSLSDICVKEDVAKVIQNASKATTHNVESPESDTNKSPASKRKSMRSSNEPGCSGVENVKGRRRQNRRTAKRKKSSC